MLETKIAKLNQKVFKLQFAAGEFDMVVFDPANLSCEIYEIKHSRERVDEQYRHLTNDAKCKLTSHRYGEIKARYVIYRGDDFTAGDIRYLNVESYLKGLGKDLSKDLKPDK